MPMKCDIEISRRRYQSAETILVIRPSRVRQPMTTPSAPSARAVLISWSMAAISGSE
jgi:hypothetical protein